MVGSDVLLSLLLRQMPPSSSTVSSYVYHSGSNSSRKSKSRKPSRREPARNAARTDALWPPDKRHLKVCFLNGNTWQKDTVKKIIKEHYNSIPMRIKFKFLADGATDSSDIRITFFTESKAYVGRDAEGHQGQTTMWLNLNPNLRKLKRQADILHEFGHALGMEHEHRHPDCNFDWNYARIGQRQGWDTKTVLHNYEKMDTRRAMLFPYDSKSIMHYSVEPGDTQSQRTRIPENTTLSDGDRKFLMAMYPVEKKPKPEPKTTTLELFPLEKTVSKRDQKPTVKRDEEHKKRLGTSWDKLNPTVITGSGRSVVKGGYVLIHGSARVEIQGGGFVRLSGSGRASVEGDSTVELNGSGRVFVKGNANVTVNGSGTVHVNGSGSAVIHGSGAVYFTGWGDGPVYGTGSIKSCVR